MCGGPSMPTEPPPRESAEWPGRPPSRRSAADRLPDAAQVLVEVIEERALDHVLGAHRRHPREYRAGLRELGVGETADRGGGGRRALLEERDRLRLAAG